MSKIPASLQRGRDVATNGVSLCDLAALCG